MGITADRSQAARAALYRSRREAGVAVYLLELVSDDLLEALYREGRLVRTSKPPSKVQIQQALQRMVTELIHRRTVTRDDKFLKLLANERQSRVTTTKEGKDMPQPGGHSDIQGHGASNRRGYLDPKS